MGIVKEMKFRPYYQMHKPESVLKIETHKFIGILKDKQITWSRPEDRTLW